jgi:Putative Flp pilus-assembly TadE/G-like
MKQELRRNHRGVTMIYALVIMVAMCMLMSLAVDYGHAQVVKTELRRAADASARAAAQYIYSDHPTGVAAAVDVASRNLADALPVTLSPATDIQYGNWNVNTKVFTQTNNTPQVNAVRVVAHRTGVPMMFASVLGRNTCDVQAESIFMATQPISANQTIAATANPFLAGMPAGSTASEINPENTVNYAGTASNPRNSPLQVNIPISEGAAVTFDSISGTASHNPTLQQVNPDGDLSETVGHNNVSTDATNNYGPTMYSQNGIGDAWIPINAVVGVFLDDNQPNTSAAPSAVTDPDTGISNDFRDPNSSDFIHSLKDFNTLKPPLKQIFFIGDGLNKNGQHQQFVAPKGATRLYLAMMDYYNWANNVGTRDMQINEPSQIIMVK